MPPFSLSQHTVPERFGCGLSSLPKCQELLSQLAPTFAQLNSGSAQRLGKVEEV